MSLSGHTVRYNIIVVIIVIIIVIVLMYSIYAVDTLSHALSVTFHK